MFLVVPLLAIVAATWRSILQLFDTVTRRADEAAGVDLREPVVAGTSIPAGDSVAAGESATAQESASAG